MTAAAHVRSQGAVALARVPLGEVEIAAKIGCNRSAVGHWRVGRKPPSAIFRRALETHFGIAPELWDLPVGAPMRARQATAKPVTIPPPPRGDETPRTLAQCLISQASVLIHAHESDPSMTPKERAVMLDKASSAIDRAGRLTGESQKMAEDRIVRLHPFRRAVERILDAAKPWPEALRAIGVALQKLERGE